ncbi:MAG: exosortase/archaeosortase family protein [Phycisphaerales bacterium]|nr:exosortase/archaeosortase family protein [Phycisphaerales bacterium]
MTGSSIAITHAPPAKVANRDGGRAAGAASPRVWQAIVLAILVLAVYRQPIETIVRRWMSDGTWSYGWLVPGLSLYFVRTRWHAIVAADRRPSYVGLVLLLASIGCFLLTLFRFPAAYPRALTLIGTIAGLTLYLCGWRVLRLVWFPIAFLFFAIPVSQSIYVRMTMPLQALASRATAVVLSSMPDVHAEVSGIVIDYSYQSQYGQLNVEQACSGMRSLMAIATLGVAIAFLRDRPAWHRLILLVTCVPIAIACNIVRVTITGVLHVYAPSEIGRTLHFEWFTGSTPHALLGLVVFMVALGIFMGVGWILDNLFVDQPRDATISEGTGA